MYNVYFEFSCSPFENTLDQRFLFMSEGHEEVITALLYFVKERKSFALVCGDVGAGKTMIVHHFLGRLPSSVAPILIPYPDAEYIEILRYIARMFNVDTQGKGTLELTDDVKATLTTASLQDRQVVLIIDEAHLLSINSLENIRLLSNIELTENKLIQILLIGQKELGLKLQRSELRQLRQRININRVLSPMSQSETIEYIEHRLRIAGSSFDRCFDSECRKLIYKITDGVPRSINRLCDTALLVAMAEKSERVTKKILKKAARALDSHEILAPGANLWKGFLRAVKSPAIAAAALILLVALGVFAYRADLSERLNQLVQGSPNGAQLNAAAENPLSLPAPGGDKKEQAASAPETASSSVAPNPVESPPAPETHADKIEPANKLDENVTAGDTAAPPRAELSPATPEETDAKAPTQDKEPEPAQSASESVMSADGVKAVDKAVDNVAPEGSPNEALDDSSFFIVTIQKGESLCQICAKWFPEEPYSAMRSILAANPQIHDPDIILKGQTLKVPKKIAHGTTD